MGNSKLLAVADSIEDPFALTFKTYNNGSNGLDYQSTDDIFATNTHLYITTGGGSTGLLYHSLPLQAPVNFNHYSSQGHSQLKDNNTRSVLVDNNNLYVTSWGGGLSVLKQGADQFTNYLASAHGLKENYLTGLFVSGNTYYVGTNLFGIDISTDGGTSWQAFTTGGTIVNAILAAGSTVYAGTDGGLSVATRVGSQWDKSLTGKVYGVFNVPGNGMSHGTLYAATASGLSVSNDSGQTWKSYAAGSIVSSSSKVNDVFVSGDTAYIATDKGLATANTQNPTTLSFTPVTGFNGKDIGKVFVVNGDLYATTTTGLYIVKLSDLNTIGSAYLTGDTLNDVFVTKDHIYVATDNGVQVSNATGDISFAPSSLNKHVNGIFFSGSKLYAATTAGIYTANTGGTDWSSIALVGTKDDNVLAIFVAGSTVYAATEQHGFININR